MLFGYFDESGIHRGAEKTAIAGLVGKAEDWDSLSAKWDEILGEKVFHYVDARNGNREWWRIEREARDRLIKRCADAIAESDVTAIIGGFAGDWQKAVTGGVDWRIRFPSVYSYCFESCFASLSRASHERWDDEPIGLVFSEQNEYSTRAFEVWRTFKGNGLWGNLLTFTYAPMKAMRPLQMADMLAYEAYQVLGKPLGEFERWPLIAKFGEGDPDKRVVGGFATTESFSQPMAIADDAGRQYLKDV